MDPEVMKALGIDSVQFDAILEKHKDDPGAAAMALLELSHPALEEVARARTAKIESEAYLLEAPIVGPIPVHVATDLDPDPLTFTLELERPPDPAEVEALTAWINDLCGHEFGDEDDHLSYWSEASAGTLPRSGKPTLTWWFDAANAGPATIRGVIDRTGEYVVASGLPAVRLLVGATE
jgi:hypothetical protein